jgi:hypothetical protein
MIIGLSKKKERNKKKIPRVTARQQWLTPIILATPKAENKRITVQASLGKQFMRPYLKNTLHRKELSEWLTW